MLVVEDWDEVDMLVGLWLVVIDFGFGISVVDCECLFQFFFIVKKVDGIGFGLWVSQLLVECYGGWIIVDSLFKGGM